LRANILTRFNFILGVLLAVILAAGDPQDALFGIVLVANALLGTAAMLIFWVISPHRGRRPAGVARE